MNTYLALIEEGNSEKHLILTNKSSLEELQDSFSNDATVLGISCMNLREDDEVVLKALLDISGLMHQDGIEMLLNQFATCGYRFGR